MPSFGGGGAVLQLDLSGVAHAIGGHLVGDGCGVVQRVITDSRIVGAGDLFVALDGARTDGHQYLQQVMDAGAVGALVMPDRCPRPAGLPCVVVTDTLQALGALARFHLGRLTANVIGITGTVGKTTAKDMLAHLLGGPQADVHAAPASYNSECGLPLAILAAPLRSRLLVLEYGVNAPGEMRRLLEIAQPQCAWITALTAVHLEGMGCLQTIIDEKLLLAAATRGGGVVYMPKSVAELAQSQLSQWQAAADVIAAPASKLLQPGRFELDIPGLGKCALDLEAAHEAQQVSIACHAALKLGVKPTDLRARVQSLPRPRGRLTRHQFGTVTVLDDAYNASPAAVSAALTVLAQQPGGRRVAVLGTMHEMGNTAESYHRALGIEAAEAGIERLIGVGVGGAWMVESAGRAGLDSQHAPTTADAAKLLREGLQANDQILLKASRAEQLETLLPDVEQAASALSAVAEGAA
ncbi:MAG: UDP-N-acetylmuramoyl-tripeptide--D-alanyl-D-alanine ligase [Planctomycetes bacterium]|nr:UDP-N-acetylmuramoyl-tripeptide--D-alanyl-D-alanine ligase [Planctomycetota bacterium]